MIFVEGLLEPEGPVLLKDNNWLVVEMDPERGCVTRISENGAHRQVVAKIGRPNGLALDGNGTIWVAQLKPPSLVRLSMDGEWVEFISECDGEPFLYPNDLVFGPDGALYLTDSGISFDEFERDGDVLPGYMTLPYDGRVYRINVKIGEISKIDTGILFANGIVFGPDGFLYVNETITGNVYRYQWKGNRVDEERLYFGNVIEPRGTQGFKGPDGMKFGKDGNLYVAVFGQGNITVLNKTGAVEKRIPTRGNKPTNCAFGPQGSNKLYVTEIELGSMQMLDVGVDGFPLYSGG